MRTADRRTVALAIAADVAAVAVFVVLGRSSHDEGNALRGVVTTAAPFLLGLAAGWVAARAWRSPTKLRVGVAVWPVTVLVAMVLRKLVFDRGTAPSFVVVATVFLGMFLVGWRLVAGEVGRRRVASPAPTR